MSTRTLARGSLMVRQRLNPAVWNAAAWRYASLVLMLLALIFDRPLTATMSLHMLIHIPLILGAGLCLARSGVLRGGAFPAWLSGFNAFGLAGLLLFNVLGAYWMIPKALDGVLLAWPEALSKYVSLFVGGWILYRSLRRADMVIQVFFIGNFCWMMAIVGLLYRDNTVRLCNFYLLDDQEIAGNGLVALAIILPMIWVWAWRHRIWNFLR